ncbi:MAG: tyrosine-type recombinase/integrase [Flavobacteriaceae bacterium]|nr:MAG: tyrosine-type recombinase/integrase [Flavobacteriaceae bacterium]
MKKLQLDNTNFQDLLKVFEKRKMDEGKSTSHITSVVNLSKEFLHFLESKSIIEIKNVTQGIIDDYFSYLKHRKNNRRLGGLSDAYIEKHREAVLRLMEFVQGVAVGQTSFFILKHHKQDIPKDILTVDEIASLFKQTDNSINGIRNKAILSILYGCGLRKGELHNLDMQDIDMSKDVIRVQKSKTATQRDVPMSPQVKTNIEMYLYTVRELLLAEYHHEVAFLLNNSGKRLSLNGIQKKIEGIAKYSTINKPITAHRLRHAIATHLLGDFSIEEIATFLGHRSIDSSQMYTHIKYTKAPKYL